MRDNFLLLTAVLAISGVAMGAFGAHWAKGLLDANSLQVYKTAVDYHLWGAVSLGLIAVFYQQNPSRLLRWSGVLMLFAVLLFSGSLYLLALLNWRWLGAITPFGGVSFILAWCLLAVFASTKR